MVLDQRFLKFKIFQFSGSRMVIRWSATRSQNPWNMSGQPLDYVRQTGWPNTRSFQVNIIDWLT